MNQPPFTEFQSAPAFQFGVWVVEQLKQNGYQALWAGGCVRDLLLSKSPSDYDVATNATPQQVRKVFGHKQTIPVGMNFGVIMVVGENKSNVIEVATFRKEGPYSDGRRPDSVVFCTPEEDAHRRDFTINGMFYDPNAEKIHDYIGGMEDLAANKIRAIGNSKDRFTEDKLRMLRAIRFSARFSAELSEETSDAIREMSNEINVVSWERISEEFRKMFAHPNRHYALKLTRELSLLGHLFPEANLYYESKQQEWDVTIQELETVAVGSFELAMSILFRHLISEKNLKENVSKVARRMKLSNQERDDIFWLIKNQKILETASELALHILKPSLSHPLSDQLIEWTRVKSIVEDVDSQQHQFCLNYLDKTQKEKICPPPLLSGDELTKMGLRPGPEFKEILNAVRNQQLDEEINSTEEAIQLAKSIIES